MKQCKTDIFWQSAFYCFGDKCECGSDGNICSLPNIKYPCYRENRIFVCVCVYNEFMLLHIYEIELFKLDLISTGMCMYKGDNQLNIRSLPYICVFFSCPVNKHILLIFSTYITDLSLKVLCVYVECARIHRILYVL